MKIIIPFLATIFLAAMTFAQEESASPAESTAPATEEKASATVEETPAAKTKEATAATTEKKAEAATSPAAAAKKETTTTTAAKPAAPGKKEPAKMANLSSGPFSLPTPVCYDAVNGNAWPRKSTRLRASPKFT